MPPWSNTDFIYSTSSQTSSTHIITLYSVLHSAWLDYYILKFLIWNVNIQYTVFMIGPHANDRPLHRLHAFLSSKSMGGVSHRYLLASQIYGIPQNYSCHRNCDTQSSKLLHGILYHSQFPSFDGIHASIAYYGIPWNFEAYNFNDRSRSMEFHGISLTTRYFIFDLWAGKTFKLILKDCFVQCH